MSGHEWLADLGESRGMLNLWTCSRCGARSGAHSVRPDPSTLVTSSGLALVEPGQWGIATVLTCDEYSAYGVLRS